MTDVQLAWLSTITWFVMTATLFLILAHWSAGEGSWGGLPGIVRGLHDWTTGDRPRLAHASSHGSSGTASPASPSAEIEEL
jgi:hypothetical protein